MSPKIGRGARYSDVMTFLVNYSGTVYQKDSSVITR
jgi:hypothetical protein